MIVPDANLLIYAHYDESSDHAAARRWWEGLVNGDDFVGIPWLVTTAFVRVITRGVAVIPAATPEQALDFVDEWFAFPHVIALNPGPDHLVNFRRNIIAAGIGGNLVMDAHIAALAMEQDAEVHSHDSDFGRFPDVRWHDPIRNPR
ncbi:MAG: type II toxin-antitoxin system VapC family toxin [Chloroflexi bacterium]|nr:type II toxin-antitoxin system VapC family toxin [Chloroflexota bacterium]